MPPGPHDQRHLLRPPGPPPVRLVLLTAAIVSALALHLRAAYAGAAWQVYVFKPLTTILVIVLAATEPPRDAATYRPAILWGLGASLAGDVFLMLPGDAFTPGLVCFLVAHLCYLRAFTAGSGLRTTRPVLAAYATYDALLMIVLLPASGPLSIAVFVYGVALVAMGWQATERALALRSRAATGAAAGAGLFILSDSVLAIDRFVAPFDAATLVVMTTYIGAQWLIARSIAGAR